MNKKQKEDYLLKFWSNTLPVPVEAEVARRLTELKRRIKILES